MKSRLARYAAAPSTSQSATRLFDEVDAIERDSDEWYTPPWIFDGLGVTFDLDVASPAEPLPWIPARDSIDATTDGLSAPWVGLVWCNPPYSDAGPWCRKWADHPDGLLLIRADLSNAGSFRAFSAASSIYVPSTRVIFVNRHGAPRSPAGSRKDPRPSFSTVLLGRGPAADTAVDRLASRYGGSARSLGQS